MKTSDKTAPRDVVQRDLFNELTEGMAALSEGRHGKRMSSGKLPTFRGQGLRPGVNLDDSAALLELMESDRDSDLRSLITSDL
jgi:hypothetical protein